MKFFEEKKLQIKKPGKIKIFPEEEDDLWVLSNLIRPNDIVSCETSRKVQKNNNEKDSEDKIKDNKGRNPTRVKFEMEIEVNNVDFDNKSSSLRVNGKILTYNSCVTHGSFHTFELEKNKLFSLEKNIWEDFMIDDLKEGSKNKTGCDLVVLLINKDKSNLFLVGKSSTNLCATIQGQFGKKKYDQTIFFQGILTSLMKILDACVLRCMVIAGPGNTKEEFKRFLHAQATKVKFIEGIKSRVLMIDVDNMGKEGLKKVLNDAKVMNSIKDTKSATEVNAMKEVNDLLIFNPDKVCYGSKSVDLANELVAIDTLLIIDDLYRNRDNEVRKKYMDLMDSVKKSGGKALVLSSMHVSGEQLAQLTGIAAVLRFPVPNLDDLEL